LALEQTERGIGLELIQREASKILIAELNDELDRQTLLWEERDEEWNMLTGQEPATISLEHVHEQDFFSGHKPSLVKPEYPLERFPNVSVMAYRGNPLTGFEAIDQTSNYNIILDIEAFVKSEYELECDARTHRTVEAIHQVFTRNEALNGLSYGWVNDPLVQITDIMSRKANISHGEDWLWQGCRIRYNLQRHTRLPS
jgi:hypothetical protein